MVTWKLSILFSDPSEDLFDDLKNEESDVKTEAVSTRDTISNSRPVFQGSVDFEDVEK